VTVFFLCSLAAGGVTRHTPGRLRDGGGNSSFTFFFSLFTIHCFFI
jgi:hypothetical protein